MFSILTLAHSQNEMRTSGRSEIVAYFDAFKLKTTVKLELGHLKYQSGICTKKYNTPSLILSYDH